MTYKRVVARNQLIGGYDNQVPFGEPAESRLPCIRGDLRRLEEDQRDEQHLAEYARRAGISRRKAKAVLDAFFEGEF